MKKKLFIASSSEELKLAKLAKEQLSVNYDVTIWNENILESTTVSWHFNESILEGLLRASLQYDYALVLGTSDDVVESRGRIFLQARDNVLFELGLFIGRMGIKNCAFVTEGDLNILSDLNGIILFKFEKGDTENFLQSIKQVEQAFLRGATSMVNFFPSTTLAAVYFENLVLPVCQYLIKNGGHKLDGKHHEKCVFTVIMPKELSMNLNVQFERIKNEQQTREVSIDLMGRPRKIYLDVNQMGERLVFVDFPTILTGINHSIKHLLKDEYESRNNDYQSILQRELSRFVATINQLAKNNGVGHLIEIKWI